MRLTEEQKEANKLARREAKKAETTRRRIESERNQKPVKSITITIEWRKSYMWGSNPHAEAAVSFQDGTFERADGFTASGCGYDKESTVIAEIFNRFLKYKLYTKLKGDSPYGMYYGTTALSQAPDHLSYTGGVGTSCYYRIAEFIGGEFVNVASGKTFDVFTYTDKEVKK